MIIYNMLQKKVEILPVDELGYNHLIVFKSYGEMQDFDFHRFKDFLWTYCSIQELNSANGIQMLCGARNSLPQYRFKKEGRTYTECIEYFLDNLEKTEKKERDTI